MFCLAPSYSKDAFNKMGICPARNLVKGMSGKIFDYFGGCQPLAYDAEGPVLPGPSIELIGQAPRVDNVTCKKIGEEE